MYHNRFSVRVIGGKEQDNGYVGMAHGKQYSLSLRNDRETPCDAKVVIDGKEVGTWRIDQHRTILLERPGGDHGHLTFYAIGTPEASAAGLEQNDPNLGLIAVTFTPGRYHDSRPLRPQWVPPYLPPVYREWPYPFRADFGTATTYTTCNSVNLNARNMSDGGAPVSAYCCSSSSPFAAVSQDSSFGAGGTGLSGHSHQEFSVAAPIIYDYSQRVTINLRLVSDKQASEVRPLVASATPVPPPVG